MPNDLSPHTTLGRRDRPSLRARALAALVSLVSLVSLATLVGGASSACSTSAPAGGDAGLTATDAGDAGGACGEKPKPLAFVKSTASYPLDATLRMNHLQAKATHNSYHVQPTSDLVDWAYSHAPLAEQLDKQGVRSFELDLHWDDECQRYEVFHIGLLDDRTTCRVFTDCLLALRGWSSAHPGHHPVFIHLEPKFASSAANDARIAAMEGEILSVFERPWLVTPDDVRGASPTLAAGVAARGWPTLGEARGRFLFYLNDTGGFRDSYTRGKKNLDGRLVFAESSFDDPFAALMILNDPIASAADIKKALAAGYIVRTRADSSPATARANNTAQREAALASGAQLVSTDFPAPVAGLSYSVVIPGGTPSRCSPGAPPGCTPEAIEDPAKLAK
ncbi:MAG TPA: Ca2+-dependent phosphoinositide-specific phospholipase C [Polyangiaceae bacterium]|nr:Ca2+-dependent phosphoinositide-specific phospholipase C [Polyangiaceae bacterium]